MNNKIVVSIANENYTIISEENEQYMRKVAACVSAKAREAAPGGDMPSSQRLLLAALNLADDYLKIQSAYDELKQAFRRSMEDNAKLKAKLK